jgi:Fusaric acid resistance protein-like
MIPTEEQNSGTPGADRERTGQAITHGALLGICCLISYVAITRLILASRIVSRDDKLLGGMWAVIATIFVFRYNHDESVTAALSRISATLLSFGLCLVYLFILPFRSWGMAALIGIGAILLSLIGRSGDIITSGITTAVVMVVAGISPQHAWKQPILRLADTVVGVAVGVFGAWIGVTMASRSPSQSPAELHRDPLVKP